MLQNKNSRRPNKIEACYRVENQQHEDCKSLTSICKVFNLRTKGDDLIKGCLVSSIVAKIKGQHKNLKSQCFNINMIDDWSRNKLFFSISTSRVKATLSRGSTIEHRLISLIFVCFIWQSWVRFRKSGTSAKYIGGWGVIEDNKWSSFLISQLLSEKLRST